MGMGTTLRSLRAWGGHVTVVELVPSVRDAFGYYFADADQVLNDPNVDVVIDDGRRFLHRTARRFDVVTIDPPPPVEAAGSSLLYSTEFYELLQTRMTDEAVLQQWFPGGEPTILLAVARALQLSFPHVRAFRSYEGWGFHFLASRRPLDHLEPETVLERLPAAVTRDLAEWVPLNLIPDLFRATIRNEVPMVVPPTGSDELVISDDRPINEYYLLRRHGLLSPLSILTASP